MSQLEKTRKLVQTTVTPPLVKLLVKTRLTPNAVTWIGFLVTVAAAALVVFEELFIAGIVSLVAGIFDMLDGALARMTGRVTKFGGILDSSLDRISEAVILLGLIYIFAQDSRGYLALLAGAAILFSFMTSYIRARMEGAGISCGAGLFTRPERVIVLALGLLLSRWDIAIIIALGVITFFSFVTTIERLVFAWKKARE